MLRQPLDCHGTLVHVGSRVRILGLSGRWLDDLLGDERGQVESMIGEVLAVDEIDEYGQPWVRKSWGDEAAGACMGHAIALEPWEMECVDDAAEMMTKEG